MYFIIVCDITKWIGNSVYTGKVKGFRSMEMIKNDVFIIIIYFFKNNII